MKSEDGGMFEPNWKSGRLRDWPKMTLIRRKGFGMFFARPTVGGRRTRARERRFPSRLTFTNDIEAASNMRASWFMPPIFRGHGIQSEFLKVSSPMPEHMRQSPRVMSATKDASKGKL